MPPKASRVGAAASGVDDPAFKFVLSVLKNCESIKPDWNEVAKENGIAYGKNATARFKSIVDNHGLKYADGKVTNPNGVAVGIATAVATPNGSDAATPKTPKSRGRKRKGDDDGVDGESPTKKVSARKGKKSQPVVKEEDEAGEEEVKAENAEGAEATGDGVKSETEE